MKTVHVRYYAVLREQRGVPEERVLTRAETPDALYQELRQRHGFSLAQNKVRAALNGEFAAPGAILKEGDQIAFLPPVAGG